MARTLIRTSNELVEGIRRTYTQNVLTTRASEDLMGYFTTYGDGGVDFLPISPLYETQIRAFTIYLGVLDRITYKPSCPQLYPGPQATDKLPLDYDQLDRILIDLCPDHHSLDEVSQSTGVPMDVVRETQGPDSTSHQNSVSPSMLRGWYSPSSGELSCYHAMEGLR